MFSFPKSLVGQWWAPSRPAAIPKPSLFINLQMEIYWKAIKPAGLVLITPYEATAGIPFSPWGLFQRSESETQKG